MYLKTSTIASYSIDAHNLQFVVFFHGLAKSCRYEPPVNHIGQLLFISQRHVSSMQIQKVNKEPKTNVCNKKLSQGRSVFVLLLTQ